MGTTIFRNIHAVDKDAGINGLVEYFVVEGAHNNATNVGDKLTSADGYGVFAISFPHQGQVCLFLSFEKEGDKKRTQWKLFLLYNMFLCANNSFCFLYIYFYF